MPFTIIATPSAVDANSYATIAEFKDYAASRFPQLNWFLAAPTDDEIAAVLVGARRALDSSFAWTGVTSTNTQALPWPRNGMLSRNGFEVPLDVVPQELKDAQSEFALQLKGGDLLSDNDPLKKGITSIKAGSVALSFSDVKGKATTPDDAEVQLRLKQSDLLYASDGVPGAVRQLLVPGWYTEADITNPLIFEAV